MSSLASHIKCPSDLCCVELVRRSLLRCVEVWVELSVSRLSPCPSLWPSGSAASGGEVGDCEQGGLSGNHREMHLPAQVQEGERTHGTVGVCVSLCVCVRAGFNMATCAGIHERVHFMQSAEICV